MNWLENLVDDKNLLCLLVNPVAVVGLIRRVVIISIRQLVMDIITHVLVMMDTVALVRLLLPKCEDHHRHLLVAATTTTATLPATMVDILRKITVAIAVVVTIVVS